jgi:signal transduction histidine kinase
MNQSIPPLVDGIPATTIAVPSVPSLPLTPTDAHWLNWLADFSDALARVDDPGFSPCLTALLIPTVADMFVVELLRPDGSIETRVAAHGDEQLHAALNARRAGEPHDNNPRSGTVQVISTGQPRFYHLRDPIRPDGTPDDIQTIEAFKRLNLASGAIVPLLIQGRPIGVLRIGSTDAAWPFAVDAGLLHEIARRIALILDNQLLRQQAQEAAEARDATLAIIAHELRIPLAALSTQLQILRRRARESQPHDERLAKGFATLDSQTRRLQLLVDTLLEAAQFQRRPRPLADEPFDLRRAVTRVYDTFAATLNNHTLRLELWHEPLVIAGDALRIEQALQNLLHNAIKYSPGGGIIELRIARIGPLARIIITDEGIGVPSADRERIFERFYRAPNAVRRNLNGIGVGLYIVHAIIALHSGRVFVGEAADVGATFVIELPLSKE